MKTINHIFDDSIIRSYDIRGIFNKTLFEKDARVIGQLFGLEVGKNKKINVGYDGRKSSEPLKDSLIEGILEGYGKTYLKSIKKSSAAPGNFEKPSNNLPVAS